MFEIIKKYKAVSIFAVITLIVMLLIRINNSCTLYFYAYHSSTSFFPQRFIYFFLYFARIFIASLLLCEFCKLQCSGKNGKILCFWSVFILISVLVEYKLIFCLESILTVIIIGVASVVGLIKAFFVACRFTKVSILLFIVIQIYMLICLVSVIV